jgi:hypothetical protein
MRSAGRKVLTWVGRAAIRRHAQLLPHAGEKDYIVSRAGKWYLVRWRKWFGQVITSVADAPRHSFDLVSWSDLENVPMPIKRRAADTASLSLPDLPNFTKLFAKTPTLVAFLTARSYEDGGSRLPGKFWFDGNSSGFSITLIDQDQGFRLVVRAGTIDDVFAAAELALGTENAPWEVDQYHATKLAEKKKKK